MKSTVPSLFEYKKCPFFFYCVVKMQLIFLQHFCSLTKIAADSEKDWLRLQAQVKLIHLIDLHYSKREFLKSAASRNTTEKNSTVHQCFIYQCI